MIDLHPVYEVEPQVNIHREKKIELVVNFLFICWHPEHKK